MDKHPHPGSAWILFGLFVVGAVLFVAVQVWYVAAGVNGWPLYLFLFFIMGDLPLFGIFLPGQLLTAMDATNKWRNHDLPD